MTAKPFYIKDFAVILYTLLLVDELQLRIQCVRIIIIINSVAMPFWDIFQLYISLSIGIRPYFSVPLSEQVCALAPASRLHHTTQFACKDALPRHDRAAPPPITVEKFSPALYDPDSRVCCWRQMQFFALSRLRRSCKTSAFPFDPFSSSRRRRRRGGKPFLCFSFQSERGAIMEEKILCYLLFIYLFTWLKTWHHLQWW